MLDETQSTALPAAEAATEREATLRKLSAIVESSTEAMVACDRDGRIETWNAGAQRIFGRSADEVIGWDLATLFTEGHREVVACLLRDAAGGHRSDLFRTVGQRADGQYVDLSVTIAPTHEAGGRVIGTCMVARDVTTRRRVEDQAARDRAELQQREAALREALSALRNSHEDLKNAQLQLIRAAKLESIGRLAAGVAHEVKNPLQIILAGTDFLLANRSLPAEQSEEVLRDLKAAVQRASTVIGGLLHYSAASDLAPSVADINPAVEKALALAQYPLARNHVEVVKDLGEGLPRLSLDVSRIEQVFVNLFMNAADAMAGGGTLTIRTRRTQLAFGEPGVGHHRTDPFRVGQTVVRVDVSDTGTGIPDEHLSKVFEPFFTLKPTGKGTGLGLAVSKTIVAMHGGTIWIRNRPEGGAIASVILRSMVA